MPSSHLILCCPLLLLPPIPLSIRVFSSESTLRMRWPKYWSFSFSIIPSKEHPGLTSFRMDWLDLLAVQGTLKGLQWPPNHDPSARQRLEGGIPLRTCTVLRTAVVFLNYACKKSKILGSEIQISTFSAFSSSLFLLRLSFLSKIHHFQKKILHLPQCSLSCWPLVCLVQPVSRLGLYVSSPLLDHKPSAGRNHYLFLLYIPQWATAPGVMPTKR